MNVAGISLEVWVAVGVGIAATVEDLARRTISNWTSLAALVGGLVCQAMAGGQSGDGVWMGLGRGALGAAAGFGIFLVFYVLGGMGGGDVKLMTGFGALLGATRLVQAAILTAILGGILAGLVLGAGYLRRAMAKYKAEPDKPLPLAIPYAPAIVLGVWLTILGSRLP
ncbi:MAG: A24 family peptidase [Bryobacteraceae bacterium]